MRSLLYFIGACVALYLVVLVFFSPNSFKPNSPVSQITALNLISNAEQDRFQQLKEAEILLEQTVRRDKIHFLPAPKIMDVKSRAEQLKAEQEQLDQNEKLLLAKISGLKNEGSSASRFKNADLSPEIESKQVPVNDNLVRASFKPESLPVAKPAKIVAETQADMGVKSERARKSVTIVSNGPRVNFDRNYLLEQKAPRKVATDIEKLAWRAITAASEALRAAPSYNAPAIRVLKKGSNIKFLYASNAWSYVQDEDGNRSWLRTNSIQ